MNSLKTETIGNLVGVQNGYAFKSSDFSLDGIPVIKIKNIDPPNVSLENVQFIDIEITEKLLPYVIKDRDILISMTGSSLNQISSAVGKVGRYKGEGKALLNQRVGRVFSLDEEKLSQDAQALFKRWFVGFEFPDENGQPYKSSGGAMQPSELGEIPVGWAVGQLGKIAINKKDSADPSSLDSETPYVGLEHIGRKSLGLSDWGKVKEVTSNKSYFSTGNILFGKLRPYFHKVSIAPFSGICSTDILVLREACAEYYGYVVMLVFSEDFVNYSNIASTGTRMPRANWKHMAEYSIPLPPKALLEGFNGIIEPMFLKIQANIAKNRTLANVRDTLLPKLMSGELRVEQANQLIEGAA